MFFLGSVSADHGLCYIKNKRGVFLSFDNDKLDPDGWLVAGHMFNCTEILEKQGAEKKNAQPTIEL